MSDTTHNFVLMGYEFVDLDTGAKGRKLVHIAGQDSHVQKQIQKNMNDPDHEWTIQISLRCDADPVDFRNSIQTKIRDYIKNLVDRTNVERRAEVDTYNANLREEINQFNRTRPSARRVFNDEKRKLVRLFVKNIPISWNKTSSRFVENDYVAYDQLLDLIRPSGIEPRHDPDSMSEELYMELATTLCDELNQPIADFIQSCDSSPEYMAGHPTMVKYLKASDLRSTDIDWCNLSKIPAAFPLLMKNKYAIDWDGMSCNPVAIHLLEEDPEEINWDSLSSNPAAIHLLEENPEEINWENLSSNPSAINLLKANPDEIVWEFLSLNPAAIDLLEANPDKINWANLSSNPAAIHLLEANPDKIDWWGLCRNPAAIHLLEANPGKIDWSDLSCNPAAIHLFQNILDEGDQDALDEINWEYFELQCYWDPYMHRCILEKMLQTKALKDQQ
jgi:hypothetical protein